jgi:glycosyltransferase involved in cell wall biosynthesis
MSDVNERARLVLEQERVAVFIVAYNAACHIEQVLRRIPLWVAERLAEIYLIDDASTDATVATAQQIVWPPEFAPLHVYRTPYNQGYGGNQRLGYLYAIERGFDIVVLLHGDGQYAPEALPVLLAAYATDSSPDAVFGSRFLMPGGALRGGMPRYKFIGNRLLTWLQNQLLGAQMSEMHSGYRSYRVAALKQIPFTHNNPGFSFDADIIVQFLAAGLRIAEVPIPTYYGDEICHVNAPLYAWQCLKTALVYRLMQFEIFYNPKFDLPRQRITRAKQAPTTMQHFARQVTFATGAHVLRVETELDLESQIADSSCDAALTLDVLEHVSSPEHFIAELFRCLKSGGQLFIGTPNVAFLPLRLMLLLGWFNYSRRGILDLTHRRLFTKGAFQRLLRDAGFRLECIHGFGPPIADLPQGGHWLLQGLDRACARLARWWPGLFAYQILAQCTRTDAPDDLMKQMFPRVLEAAPTVQTNEAVMTSQQRIEFKR